MTEAELEEGVAYIIRDLVDDDALPLDTTMSAKDVPGWDSFTQVEFIAALEDRFSLQLPLAEVEQWQTIDDVLLSLRNHMTASAAD